MKCSNPLVLVAAVALTAVNPLVARQASRRGHHRASAARRGWSAGSRASRFRMLASRGNLRAGGRDDLGGVLLSSPKAIWIQKSARRLTLYERGEAIRTCLITIGRNQYAAKEERGDWATPEGLYHVRRKNPESKYYLALHIDYPNADDAERGLAAGIISPDQCRAIRSAIDAGELPPQDTPLGYYVEIHGGSNRVVFGEDGQPYLSGWTRGCVGLRNADITDIYAWAPVGTPVVITH